MTKRTTALIGAMSLIAGGTVMVLVSLRTPTTGAGRELSTQVASSDAPVVGADPATTGGTIESGPEPTFPVGSPASSDQDSDAVNTPSEGRSPARLASTGPKSDSTAKRRVSSVGVDLLVSETTEPSLTRTYAWNLANDDADKSTDTYNTSGNASGTTSGATVGYVVSATRDEGTDGDFAVTGEITIENPNDFAVHQAEVTDAIDGGGHCWVASATDQTIQLVPVLIVDIAAGESVTVPYACTFADEPGAGEDTATVTVDPDTNPKLPALTFHDTERYDFDQAFVNPAGASIDVTDSLGGSHHFDGTETWTYDITFASDPAGVCTPHSNTVTIAGTDISANKDVLVCADADQTGDVTPPPPGEPAA